MQVAIRKPTKGTLVPLWLHEYYAVHKSKIKVNGKCEVDIYQIGVQCWSRFAFEIEEGNVC